jgi:preprotein translocase subunit SecE
MALRDLMDKGRNAMTFLVEVRSELKKVHWPTRQETYAATGVVLVIVAVVALYLGMIDLILAHFVKAVLG